MTCYKPNKVFVIKSYDDVDKETGEVLKKRLTKFCGSTFDHLEWRTNGVYEEWYKSPDSLCSKFGTCGNKICNSSCYDVDPKKVPATCHEVVTDYLSVPCGKCIGCRIDLAKEWAARMVMELPYSTSSWFITLTYNDDFLPLSQFSDSEGNKYPSMTLCKKDFQDFMKRLRKRFPGSNIRYYVCGEYGSESLRPHYHAILFNAPLDFEGKSVYSQSREGFTYYTTPVLNRAWSVYRRDTKEWLPMGFALCSPVSYQTCLYVARYVTKKLVGLDAYQYQYYKIEPEFSTMSRKPGLGRQWFEDHKSEEDLITYIIRINDTSGDPLKFKRPKYFENLYEIEYPELCTDMKTVRRKIAEDSISLKLSETDVSYYEMLENEQRELIHRLYLKRGDV